MLFLRRQNHKVKVECGTCGKVDGRSIPIGHRVVPINADKIAGLMEAKDYPDRPALPIRWLRCQGCGVFSTLFLWRKKDGSRKTETGTA
jgi:hypothetical protein